MSWVRYIWTAGVCAAWLHGCSSAKPDAADSGMGGRPADAGMSQPTPDAQGGAGSGPAHAGATAGAAGEPTMEAGGSAAVPSGAAGAAGSLAAPSCTLATEDLGVAGADRAGYPPYAASGCSLLYVAGDGSLRLRALANGDETLLAPASEQPSRPTLAGPADDPARVIAWESGSTHSVQVRFAGATREVRGTYARSGQPRACANAVVLSGFHTQAADSDADILLYDPQTQAISVVGGGPGQQLFADVSETRIAYSDFAEDPDGRFDNDGRDLADLVLVDRATGEPHKLQLAGKQAFPLFGSDGSLVYLHWEVGHPEPKLAAYAIMNWDTRLDRQRQLARVETQPPYVRPSVYGATVEWVERPYDGAERLMRVDMQGVNPRTAFSMPGVQLYATASSASATLLAVQTPDQLSPRLRAIAR